MRNQTKRQFENALYALLTAMPFEKVKVKDLCAYCGSPRQTFYYHFRDKYDLVAWIFRQDFAEAFERGPIDSYEDALVEILESMRLKETFYRQVFKDRSQNSIREYLQDFDVETGIDAVKKHFQVDAVTDEQLYLIKHYSYGTIFMTLEWLLGHQKMTAKEFVHCQILSMPEFLREAYRDYY